MRTDNIVKVEIDSLDRLRIYPEKEKFNFIWRSATEVHWDDNESFLYSPKPREWSYFDWYRQIIGAIQSEYGFNLLLLKDTLWINIPAALKEQIIKVD